MKRLMIVLACLMLQAASTSVLYAGGPTKIEKRVAYTLKNLKLTKDKETALKPMLTSYLNELKEAKKAHKEAEDKYGDAADKGTINDAGAKALLESKYQSGQAELNVKKAYCKKFATVISYKKVLKCFDLLNDKMSKVEGKKKAKASKDTDDDDD